MSCPCGALPLLKVDFRLVSFLELQDIGLVKDVRGARTTSAREISQSSLRVIQRYINAAP